MRFNILPLFLFFCASIFIFSCSSTRTYKRVNNVIYPEYRLPDDTKQLVLLNSIQEKTPRNSYTRERFASTGDTEERTDYEFGAKGKSGYMIDRLESAMKRGNFYLIKEASSSTNETVKWNKNNVENYAGDGDVLVVLENFTSDYDFNSKKIRKHQLDQSGNDYYVNAQEASRLYKVNSQWGVYDGSTGEQLFDLQDSGEKFIKTQGLQKDQTIEKLDSISRGLERFLIDSIAQSFSRMIMPEKIFDTWSYYRKGSDALEEGNKYMELDKLEDAESIYQRGIRGADEEEKAKLYYNIAIIKDIMGDLEAAFNYAEKAVLTDDKSLHKSFYEKVKLKKEISGR